MRVRLRHASSLALILGLCMVLTPPARPQASAASPLHTEGANVEGRFSDGSLWRARVPAAWNGTLLLYSHGYSPSLRAPELAPRGVEDWLLAHGYALAASSYSSAGWAVAEAVPDQEQLLGEFAARFGTPHSTIAWGDSMGGLITTALVESPGVPIAGGLSACGSISGTLAMMNTALDGAFAFVMLQAPESGIQLVGVADDRANTARVADAVAMALQSPAGRARLALAGVLGGLPVWTQPGEPPAPGDYDAQLAQMAHAVAGSLFPPRADQERRAGGVLSWNTGIDYARLLRASGRKAWVAHFYQRAGLDLEADLRRLAAAPRIGASAAAIDYMRQHYSPDAQPRVPFLSLHTIGDGLTSQVFQAGYTEAAAHRAAAERYRAVSVSAAGHCAFSAAEYVAALQTLEARLRSGRWQVAPGALNRRAAQTGLGPGRFVSYRPAPLLRACWSTTPVCAGAPAP